MNVKLFAKDFFLTNTQESNFHIFIPG